MTTACGGEATPFRIPVAGRMIQEPDELARNAARNTYPRIGREGLKDAPLAIAGGGPSLADHIDVLRAWEGPIWAVNRTPNWLHAQGVSSVLVSVDASPKPADFCEPETVSEAIFSSWCDPDVLARYSGVRVFDMFPLFADGVVGTTTTAGSMTMLAFRMGYRSVTLFGCEGSFEGVDHIDRHEALPEQFIVRANGIEYRTTPDFLLQCDEISRLIRDVPQFLKERSGGLLRAMVADPDWTTVAVSGPLKEHLEKAGMTGIDDTPYARGAD